MIKPWKVRKSACVLQDKWISVRADACETAGGTILDPYYVLEYPDWVFLTAFDARRRILVTRLYRHGNRTVNLEIPAGRVEPDDASPEIAARRELLEETGYTSDQFVRLATMTPNSATHSNSVHAIAAMDVRRVAEPAPDRDEQIEFEFLEIPRLLKLIDSGEFSQALHIATIFHALRHLGWLDLKKPKSMRSLT